jgi:hypothetical protein
VADEGFSRKQAVIECQIARTRRSLERCTLENRRFSTVS